jgi:ATP-dependent DNA helicase DinG
MLSKADSLICWLETDRDENRFCAIPKDLNEQLQKDLWNKGIPTVLTSGTLSANGDFSHIKRTLGLDRVIRGLIETSKPSPFDFKENALLYISENVPFPDQHGQEYILSVANEVEELIRASNGHAAVLFTSYRAMELVCEHLAERDLPFPMFRLNKGGIKEIERFKKSGNGVLFAAGALWEGIDIPGDALSMLIIVKLPFAVPDPSANTSRHYTPIWTSTSEK